MIDRLEGQSLRRLALFDRRGGAAADGVGSTAAWLRWHCRLAGRDAVGTVRCARQLSDALPATAVALAGGEISRRHAGVLTAASADLPDAAVAAAEPTLLAAAYELDPDQLRKVARQWRHAVDAERCLSDANAAHDRRYLHLSPLLDGLVAIHGLLDADAGAGVLGAITALSAPLPEESRTPAQRRADALAELARRALDGGSLPASGGEQAQVTVVVDLPTLESRAGARAADLDWSGPVPGETARRLSCDATLSRVITNGASEVLDVGRRSRLVPAGLRRALQVRDGGCIFPGCDRPPAWTEAHHITHCGPAIRHLSLPRPLPIPPSVQVFRLTWRPGTGNARDLHALLREHQGPPAVVVQERDERPAASGLPFLWGSSTFPSVTVGSGRYSGSPPGCHTVQATTGQPTLTG